MKISEISKEKTLNLNIYYNLFTFNSFKRWSGRTNP